MICAIVLPIDCRAAGHAGGSDGGPSRADANFIKQQSGTCAAGVIALLDEEMVEVGEIRAGRVCDGRGWHTAFGDAEATGVEPECDFVIRRIHGIPSVTDHDEVGGTGGERSGRGRA